tara:strand:- start:3925 stop:5568 length:1644 start_codon:yes stop_codon:yes gene_type:complete
MASGVRLRSNGGRVPQKMAPRDLIGPALGLSSDGQPGEHRLNATQIASIEHLFNSHPAISAARSILHGQLFAGGIVVRRGGKDVDLTPAFRRHLDDVWTKFAGDAVDSFLKWGYTVMVFEDDEDSLTAQQAKRRRREAASRSSNLIPVVPARETYTVGYVRTGRAGYRRKYIVHAQSPQHASKVDDEAIVVVRDHPDAGGNVNSPMAQVFDLGSFASALLELAMTAEITNARPRVWTQMAKKPNGGALDPQSLFFDSSSRAVQNSQDGEDNARQLDALAMQQRLTQVINRLQTTNPQNDTHQPQSFSGGGVAAGKSSYVPPEVPPAVFVLPKEQEIAPSAGQLPQARGDLEALQRLAVEQFGAAFGVPADLFTNGKFASKSTAQLSLLNSSVSQLAKWASLVLTRAYAEIYGDDADDNGEPTEVTLLTAPLAATDEVIALHAAGLCPVEVAVPATLHAIGCSREQIDNAVDQAVKDRDQTKANEQGSVDDDKRSRDQDHKAKEGDQKASEQRIVVELEATKAATEKTRAETEQVKKGPTASGSAEKA